MNINNEGAANAGPETTHNAEVPHRPIIIPAEIKTEPGTAVDETLADIETALAVAVGQEEAIPNTAKELSERSNTAPALRIKTNLLATVESTAPTSQETLQNVAAAVPAAATEPLQSTPTPRTAAEEPPPNVKTEPVAAEDATENVPDSFFDELLQSADEIQAATLSPHPTAAAVVPPIDSINTVNETSAAPVRVKQETADTELTPAATATQETENNADANVTGNVNTNANAEAEEETIPQDFFDDLLVDRVAQRVENAVNEDLEVKFSERLKELNELEALEKKKSHKKKKKKKSQKRARSKSAERGSQKRRRSRSRSCSPHNDNRERIRIKSEFAAQEVPEVPQRTGSLFPHEQPTSSNRARLALRVKAEFHTPEVIDVDELCLPVQSNEIFTRRNMNGLIIDETTPLGFTRIKLEKDTNDNAFAEAPLESLTPQAKQKRAMQRAVAAIEVFKKAREQKDNLLSTFLYTSTVRKLPTNRSYVTQQIYDNRSPLHTVNNVSFKFNSNATRLNLREWGLEALPSVAATVAKTLGYDAHTLKSKLQTIKLPPNLQRIMRERAEGGGEDVEEPHSSYFTNAMTQTDEVTILSGKHRNGFDIGVQVKPYTSSIGVQTTEAGSSSSGSYDNSPLMQQLKILNENQLLAVSDFAELVSRPATDAMDMYVVLKRIQDIYKCSQIPSALPTRQTSIAQHSPSFSYESAPRQQHVLRDPRSHAIQHQPRTIPHQSQSRQLHLHSAQHSVYPTQTQTHSARHSHHAPAPEYYQASARPSAPLTSGSYAVEPYPQDPMAYNTHPTTPYTHNVPKPSPKLYGRGAKRY